MWIWDGFRVMFLIHGTMKRASDEMMVDGGVSRLSGRLGMVVAFTRYIVNSIDPGLGLSTYTFCRRDAKKCT